MDDSNTISLAALVFAVAAALIALTQAVQQYMVSGPLIRLCDRRVFGPMPGGGRRVWSTQQFRWRVLYSIPQIYLPTKAWNIDLSRLESFSLQLRDPTLPPLITHNRMKERAKSTWQMLLEPLRNLACRFRQKSDVRDYDLAQIGTYCGAESKENFASEACWVAFSRMAQIRCRYSFSYKMVEGDADRCPSDLQVVPMLVSLRDIVALCFAFGLRVNSYDPQSETLHMSGECGTLLSSRHSSLGTTYRFLPRKDYEDVETAYKFQAPSGGFDARTLWLARARGCSKRAVGRLNLAVKDDYSHAVHAALGKRYGLHIKRPIKIEKSACICLPLCWRYYAKMDTIPGFWASVHAFRRQLQFAEGLTGHQSSILLKPQSRHMGKIGYIILSVLREQIPSAISFLNPHTDKSGLCKWAYSRIAKGRCTSPYSLTISADLPWDNSGDFGDLFSQKLCPVSIACYPEDPHEAKYYGASLREPGGLNKAANDRDLCELMMLDYWLSSARSEPEVGYAPRVQASDVEEFLLIEQRYLLGLDVDADGCHAYIAWLWKNLLPHKHFSGEEKIYLLVWCLRTVRYAQCMVAGPDSSALEQIAESDPSVYLA